MSVELLEEALENIDAALDALRRCLDSLEEHESGELEDIIIMLEEAADSLDSFIDRRRRVETTE